VSIEKLLNPQSIAIVGVSTKKATFQVGGRAIFDHLRKHGYPHRIDIITREPATIDGVESATNLDALTYSPDCILISVPATEVYATIEKGLALGSRAFVTLTAGFSESGERGREEQDRIAALLKDHGAVMLGPNTTGFVNFGACTAMSSTSRVSAELSPAGNVGLVVQSGALGSGLLEEAARNGIGLSHLISTGNEAVTTLADCIDYLVECPEVRAIALYVESFRESDRIVNSSRMALNAGKPIAVYKTGRSEVGRKAAAGHTGALVGNRGAYDAAVEQLGWIDVRAIEDLLPIANYAAIAGPAKTMGIMSVSGGYGGCLADALAVDGRVTLPAPAPETVARMRDFVPSFLSANNPVDIGGTPFRHPDGFAQCLDALADDPSIEAVTIANTPIVPAWGESVAKAAADTHARTGKPVSVVWPSEIFNAEALAMIRASKLPAFGRVDTFAAAVSGTAAADAARSTPSRLLREGRVNTPVFHDGDPVALDEAESKTLLKGLGVSFPRELFVEIKDIGTISAAAEEIGYPVTLKGMASGVVHKSEFGLVAVRIPDATSLDAQISKMKESAKRNSLDLRGYLIGETVSPKAEVIAGLSLDPEFGPVLTFGAGGIYTEVMQDATVRLLPLDRAEIKSMIERCRIAKVLNGARGKAALDVEALATFLVNLADLAPHMGPEITGLEINPIGVGATGGGVWALDATVFQSGGT